MDSISTSPIPGADDPARRHRRVERARRAFHEFRAQCFWSWVDDPVITEETVPAIIRELRQYGGARGYQVVAEICR